MLSNPDLKALQPFLKAGKTPVIIANDLDWIEGANASEQLEALESEKQRLQATMEDWRKAWVSQDTDAYLNYYSKKFFYDDGGFEKWAEYKRGIQASKPKVSIQIEDVSMFAYPATKQPVIVVNFEQNFKSSNLQNKMRKRQYWMFDDNQWKIIYEGVA